MARLNIEDCWWTDPRRSALSALLGSEPLADAYAIRAWRLGQDFWKHGRQLVPKSLFDILPGAASMIQSGLADVRESFVYVRGSSAYLEWIAEKREQAKVAGKKSAESRMKKTGSAQPKKSKNSKPTEPTWSNEPRTEINDAEPSCSRSLSVSENKESTSCTGLTPVDLQQELIPKQSKFKEPTKEKMRAFIATYAGAYKARYNSSPEGLRDKAVVGKIGHWIETVSEQRACELAQVFLQIDYKPINDSCHDLWQFFRHLNRIGNALNTGADPSGIDWAKVFGGAS